MEPVVVKYCPPEGSRTLTLGLSKISSASLLRDSLWSVPDAEKMEVTFKKAELDALLHLFAAKEPGRRSLDDKSAARPSLLAASERSPLEPKRVFNCSLLLKKLMTKGVRDADSIVAALISMDPRQLLGKGGGTMPPGFAAATVALSAQESCAAMEVIKLLEKCSPTADELEALETVDPAARLGGGFGAVEQWFVRLSSPELQPLGARLSVLRIIVECEADLHLLTQRLDAKLAAATAATASAALRYWSHACLTTGNFLNHGNKRFSNARGYKVGQMLSKLAELKSTDTSRGSVSLQDFVVSHSAAAHGGAYSAEVLAQELHSVGAAVTYPWEQLAVDLRVAESDGATLAAAAAEGAALDAEASSRYAAVCAEWSAKHRCLLAAAKGSFAAATAAMTALCAHCGERADANAADALLEALAALVARTRAEPSVSLAL